MAFKWLYIALDGEELQAGKEWDEILKALEPEIIGNHIFYYGPIIADAARLSDAIRDFRPTAIHIVGHGSNRKLWYKEKFLAHSLSSDDLVTILRSVPKLDLLYLSACNSEKLAEDLKDYAKCIVAFPDPVLDQDGARIAGRFYFNLTRGCDAQGALAETIATTQQSSSNRKSPVIVPEGANFTLPVRRFITMPHQPLIGYLRDEAKRCSEVKFPGLPEDKILQLVKLYINLHTIDYRENESEPEFRNRAQNPSRRVTLIEEVRRLPRLVILGLPGQGKTTFLRHLAYCLACQHFDSEKKSNIIDDHIDAEYARKYLESYWQSDDSYKSLIPIWIELRKLVEYRPAKNLTASTEEQASRKGLRTTLSNWLIEALFKSLSLSMGDRTLLEENIRKGNVLFLIDGLDEIFDDDLVAVKEALHTLRINSSANRMILTCRHRTWDAGWGIKGWGNVRVITGFDIEDRIKFLDHWFGPEVAEKLFLLDEIEAISKKNKLLEFLGIATGKEKKAAIENRRLLNDLEEMLSIPLLLTMFAWLQIHTETALPRQRPKLYERFISALLWEIDDTKGLKGQTYLSVIMADAKISKEAFYATLCKVTFEAHKDAPESRLVDIRREQFTNAFFALYKACEPNTSELDSQRPVPSDWINKLLNTLQFRCGLTCDNLTGVYRFQHRSFQEYLAASSLTLNADGLTNILCWWYEADEKLRTSRREGYWEVLKLAVGRLVHVEGVREPAIRGAINAFPLVAALSICQPRNGQTDWHDVWLAAELLEELDLIKHDDMGRRIPMLPPWESLALLVADQLRQLLEGFKLSPVEMVRVATIYARIGDH